MERAVALAQEEGPLEAVGLGALCAVVAGRGEALGERLDIPVTTGAAATTWALSQNTQKIAEHQGGGPVAVVGSSGVVGHAVAASLVEAGLVVRVDSRRGARGLDVEVCAGPEEAVKTCTIVVGAGPTGGTLDGQALEPGSVVVDVAIPGTLRGRVPKGIQVLAGEAMSLPEGWTRGGWGHVFHLMAGYGPRQVFACLVEPLVLAAQGGTEPFSQGRRLEPGSVAKFGEAAREFGFHPRLARGWSRVDLGPDLG
jgi:predicted amino acid dehydrogenase